MKLRIRAATKNKIGNLINPIRQNPIFEVIISAKPIRMYFFFPTFERVAPILMELTTLAIYCIAVTNPYSTFPMPFLNVAFP